MDTTEQSLSVLDQLLQHDLEQFAARMGLLAPPQQLSSSIAVQALNLAEYLSRRSRDDASRNICLGLSALVWDHRDESWAALPSLLVQLFARLGLGPTTTMVDPLYDRVSGVHGTLGSIRAELDTAALLLQYEVAVGGIYPVLLSQFQWDCWTTLESASRLVMSAPTSAGKSFVLVEKIADLLLKGAQLVVYIVPTLSLVHQVTRDIRQACLKYELSDVVVSQSYAATSEARVIVLTQERAWTALVGGFEWPSIDLLVVDEIQNIERVGSESEERARTLYNSIEDFLVGLRPTKVVVCGPRLAEAAKLAEELFGAEGQALSAELPPVVSICYTFSKTGKAILIRQYSELRSSPREIKVDIPTFLDPRIFRQKEYTPAFYGFLSHIVGACAADGGTIVFSPTTYQARHTAERLALDIPHRPSQAAFDLAEYVASSVHPEYPLVDCIRAGIGFHHSKLPLHLRHAVERAFSEHLLQVLVCTTTLMQGVNIPAKTIIARNPNLFIKRYPHSVQLTSYEFANLRGRAGRLMVDLIGRAVILDEGSFEDAQLSFAMVEKQVRPGYSDRFNTHREDIVDAILSAVQQSNETAGYGDLLVHIRHAVLRHGEDAKHRLSRMGIELTESEFSSIRRVLRAVQVPQVLLDRCPGWDPLVLHELSERRDEFPELPSFPRVRGFETTLRSVLDTLSDVVPFYFSRILDLNPTQLRPLTISARQWSAEEPLNEILRWNRDAAQGVAADDIEDRLEMVQQSVVYDLPKLLRPIVTIQNEESPLLSYLELGAHRPETRMLIQFGLAREPARVIVDYWRAEGLTNPAKIPTPDQLPSLLNRVLPWLNRWERAQVVDIFPALR